MTQRHAAAYESSLTADPLRIDLKIVTLTIFVVITDVLGNLTMSWGLRHQPEVPKLAPMSYIYGMISPWILLGTSLLLLWLLSRMILLSWADLSYVIPTTSFSYIFNGLAGYYVLGEKVSRLRWTGTLLIMVGAALVGLTRSNTTAAPKEDPL